MNKLQFDQKMVAALETATPEQRKILLTAISAPTVEAGVDFLVKYATAAGEAIFTFIEKTKAQQRAEDGSAFTLKEIMGEDWSG